MAPTSGRHGPPLANREEVCERYELYHEAQLKEIKASPAYSGMDQATRRTIDDLIRTATAPLLEHNAPPGTVGRSVQYQRNRHTTMRRGANAMEATGRAWASAGAYQSMWASLRAALAGKIYSNVDIVNASATIALHTARTQVPPVRTPLLAEYVEEREMILGRLGTELQCGRAAAKTAVIAVMFGCRAYQHSSTWLADLRCEMAALNDRVPWLGGDHEKEYSHSRLAQFILMLSVVHHVSLRHMRQGPARYHVVHTVAAAVP